MQTALPQTDKERLATELSQSKNRLVSDFKNLVQDAEELLRAAGSYSGEGFTQARAKFEEKLGRLKDTVADAQTYAGDTYKQAAASTQEYVANKPWQAIGIAAAVGVLIGVAVGSSFSRSSE
jgi:ElaB/YqjD/DUF883 family membrane-anchored ribosome-binding protein